MPRSLLRAWVTGELVEWMAVRGYRKITDEPDTVVFEKIVGPAFTGAGHDHLRVTFELPPDVRHPRLVASGRGPDDFVSILRDSVARLPTETGLVEPGIPEPTEWWKPRAPG